MSRPHLTQNQKQAGRTLGRALQRRRGSTPGAQIAIQADVSLDVLRKVERGAVATPGFFLVARLASVLEVSLDELAHEATVAGSKGDCRTNR